nr:helix-turn-helix transcriptional regulator [uncultured Dyadobacter sp.]
MQIEIRLRSLRDARKLSTRMVAERVGVSQSTYMDWERNRSYPSLRLLEPLAMALDVCSICFVAYLFGQMTLEELLVVKPEATISELTAAAQQKPGGEPEKNSIDLMRRDMQRLEMLLRQNLIAALPAN